MVIFHSYVSLPEGNVYIANWKDPPCSMGKSTISTGPCSRANREITRGYLIIYRISNNVWRYNVYECDTYSNIYIYNYIYTWLYNVGKTIINHPPPMSSWISGINHSQIGGLLLCYPHYIYGFAQKSHIRLWNNDELLVVPFWLW